MTTLVRLPKRQIEVPHRRLALSEEQRDIQIQQGLYTVQRGVPLAIPLDNISNPREYGRIDLWRHDEEHGTYRAGVRFQPRDTAWQKKALAWMRDHVHEQIPYWYYMATLGHDLHVSTFAHLYARQWHQGWADPFDPEDGRHALDMTFDTYPRLFNPNAEGFIEDLGLLSGGKVSDAFVSEEIDELVSTTGTEYADFDFHEVGTSSQAENNNDTALITTSGITRATGTPTDSDPIYQNVGTITADATETWEEHGLFNNLAGASLMDRSLTGGQPVVSGNQVEYTYQLTKNPEA